MLGKGLESLIPSQKPASTGDLRVLSASTPSTLAPTHTPVSPSPALVVGTPLSPDVPREIEAPSLPAREISIESPEVAPFVRGADEEGRSGEAVFQIETTKIESNPHQPRRYFDDESLKELAASIREFGIVQPLIVTKKLEETESGSDVRYQLIAGERRLRAARLVGLRTVPAIVRSYSVEREKLEVAIIENIQRADLNPIETARSFSRLQDEFGFTQREIASRLGKSRETVSNTLRLLQLPTEIQVALEEGKINESHARLLLQIENIAKQEELFHAILETKPTIRELKARLKDPEDRSAPRPGLRPEIREFTQSLEEALGTKVKIDGVGEKGSIVIAYYSEEELASLIDRLTRRGAN